MIKRKELLEEKLLRDNIKNMLKIHAARMFFHDKI